MPVPTPREQAMLDLAQELVTGLMMPEAERAERYGRRGLTVIAQKLQEHVAAAVFRKPWGPS